MAEKFKPVYFFSGTNEPPKQKRIDELKKLVLGESITDFNNNIFYADSTPAIDVIEAAQTLCFDSKFKFIIVKRIDTYNVKDKKILTDYAKNPNPGTCLILASSERPNKREAWYKNLAAAATEEVFWPYNEMQLIKLLQTAAAKKNKKIELDAARYFASLVGNNPVDIDTEIKNILDYIQDKQTITVQDIHTLLTNSTTQDIYNWTMILTDGKHKEALRQLQLFSPKEISKITYVLYILSDRYIKILKYILMLKENIDAITAQKKLGIIKFLDPNFHKTAQKYSTKKLAKIFDKLLTADFCIKTGKGESKQIIENLIVEIAKIMTDK